MNLLKSVPDEPKPPDVPPTYWVIDPGHGGMAFDHYVTKGKRSPHVPPGIYEGFFNRLVATSLHMACAHVGMPLLQTAPGPINTPMRDRVAFVNSLPVAPLALISVHANADGGPGDKWSAASGSRIFVSKRASQKSCNLAALIAKSIDSEPRIPYGRRSTMAVNHAITTRTKCPAVYMECGFMTNENDATFLGSEEGPAIWAETLWRAMRQYAGVK